MKNILDALKWRYAVKVFDPAKKIPAEKIDQLKEALVLTPSSFGLQPWKFLFITNPEIREKLKAHSWNQGQITDASHLVVLCRQEKIDEDFVNQWVDVMATESGRPAEKLEGYRQMVLDNVVKGESYRAKQQDVYMKNQVFIALGNLLTTAAALEIDTCAIGGFDPEKYDEILGLKDKGLRSCVVCPLGYWSDDDWHKDDPKVRFASDQIIEDIE